MLILFSYVFFKKLMVLVHILLLHLYFSGRAYSKEIQHSIAEDICCLGSRLQAPPGLLQPGGGRDEPAVRFRGTGSSTGNAERHLQLSSSGQTAQGAGYALNI